MKNKVHATLRCRPVAISTPIWSADGEPRHSEFSQDDSFPNDRSLLKVWSSNANTQTKPQHHCHTASKPCCPNLSGYSDRKGIHESLLRLAEWAYKLSIKITISRRISVSFFHYSSQRWPHCAWMGCGTSSTQRNPVIRRSTNRLWSARLIWRRAHECKWAA